MDVVASADEVDLTDILAQSGNAVIFVAALALGLKILPGLTTKSRHYLASITFKDALISAFGLFTCPNSMDRGTVSTCLTLIGRKHITIG